MCETLDINIFLTAVFSFFVFLGVHFIVFRHIEEKTVLSWLMRIYYLGALVNLFVSFTMLGFGSIVFVFFSFLLYTMLVFCYILGIFGLMESSIRIGLIMKIGQSSTYGMRKQDILKNYNRRIIVAKRLKRFVASGELKYQKGYYLIKKKFSYFIINDFINSFMRKIYEK